MTLLIINLSFELLDKVRLLLDEMKNSLKLRQVHFIDEFLRVHVIGISLIEDVLHLLEQLWLFDASFNHLLRIDLIHLVILFRNHSSNLVMNGSQLTDLDSIYNFEI